MFGISITLSSETCPPVAAPLMLDMPYPLRLTLSAGPGNGTAAVRRSPSFAKFGIDHALCAPALGLAREALDDFPVAHLACQRHPGDHHRDLTFLTVPASLVEP